MIQTKIPPRKPFCTTSVYLPKATGGLIHDRCDSLSSSTPRRQTSLEGSILGMWSSLTAVRQNNTDLSRLGPRDCKNYSTG